MHLTRKLRLNINFIGPSSIKIIFHLRTYKRIFKEKTAAAKKNPIKNLKRTDAHVLYISFVLNQSSFLFKKEIKCVGHED